ncbi:sulfite exporter TauE/SafE family protein [Microvirga guangxiensis]|uniref:Probable membrane transporter protein n=1 Tax=Microvirga guangxiensis TaxID=549386 RepID=A0A1G5KDU0_9HYPH|nr:sulfite exporter TauE/SafE family protein [Microvirga guangxiensis]SCY98238.1 hypothetical protein SAMN02927923_03210 [Microvirga guangxiensis]
MWEDVMLFAAVGFAAQVIDGALGMAYGVTATAVLLSLGVTPSVASASVHAAEVFTTGASGAAHWRLGNVDRALFRRLATAGVCGGILGAYLLTFLPGAVVRPLVSGYLLIMGGLILWRALRGRSEGPEDAPLKPPLRHVGPLGLGGGFLDAIGGGGWGAMVTSTLIGHGVAPRLAIGSANLAEFFVTSVITATFVVTIGLELWPTIAGLVLGGVLAAPFAALVTRKVPDRPLMLLVGAVIVFLSLRGLLQALR